MSGLNLVSVIGKLDFKSSSMQFNEIPKLVKPYCQLYLTGTGWAYQISCFPPSTKSVMFSFHRPIKVALGFLSRS